VDVIMSRKHRAGMIFGSVLIASLGAVTPASACVVFKPFRMGFIANAQSVFRGTVIDYRYEGGKPAIITFKVTETLHGAQRDSWVLSWRNSTFPLPERWLRPVNQIVAVKGEIAVGVRDAVLQEGCTKPFLMEDNETNREWIAYGLACLEDDTARTEKCGKYVVRKPFD
jgi:hypothetical protein